jgi:predicted DNA-binding transcriptional regulator YafY
VIDQERKVRRGIKQRLEFIDFRLFWEGRINRSDIMERFKISTPQASKDLSLYESMAPGNLVYDVSGKRYLASSSFVPKLIEPNADEYLMQLRNISDRTLPIESTWLSTLSSAESMPIPARRVNVKVLRSLIGAIESRRAIKVFYQSMNEDRPKPTWRWIIPHALAHDGLRWHVRAFCEEAKKFKDFVLSRCLDSGEGRETEIRADQDREWNEVFSVVLIPNPRLSLDQQEVISQDYCMDYGQIAVSVKKALLYYFNKRLRLDVARALDNPKETPVVVLNEKAFSDVLAGLEPNQS